MASIQLTPETPVIVTGGASGIGRASAEALAEAGRPVAIWDLDPDKSSGVADAIASAFGVKTIGLGVDVSRLDDIAGVVKQSRDALGTIGGLVHAAGIDGVGALEDLTLEQWSATLDINLRAEIFILQEIVADLKANAGSAVVGIASINGTLGNAMNPAYSASKAGLLGMSRALADDLGNSGVRINCISPGQIDTPMLQSAMNQAPGLRESFEKRILLGRLAEPSEIGKAVRFLMSDEASYITGAELIVDGGNVSSQRS